MSEKPDAHLRGPQLEHALVGSWLLRSYTERELQTGTISHPFGEDAIGTITYTDEGRMSVLISRSDLSSGRTDLFEMSAEEAMRTATGFLAYSGRYDCEHNLVQHRVEISSIPAFARATQQRTAQLDGDRLTLSTVAPIVSHGRTVDAVLVWDRSPTSARCPMPPGPDAVQPA